MEVLQSTDIRECYAARGDPRELADISVQTFEGLESGAR